MSLSAAEDNTEYSEFVKGLLNNKYMVENRRLLGLAESAYADAKYDDAVKYAQEANKYAQLSDEYVASQTLIRDTNDAITAAQTRLDQAKKADLHVKNATTYGKAEAALAEALAFRSKEQWNPAKASALSVITILSEISGVQGLPAQYRVKTWSGTRDCLWNIAAKKEIYGDPWKWTVIYNANKNKLPEPGNPDLVEPGILLDIPSIKGEFRAGIMED
jgi:nucleoid-associated protein YgaU